MQKIFFGFFWLKTLESIKRAKKCNEWMQKSFFGFLTKITIESINRAAEDLRPQNDSSNNFKNQKSIS
jgi:hypothetical protein